MMLEIEGVHGPDSLPEGLRIGAWPACDMSVDTGRRNRAEPHTDLPIRSEFKEGLEPAFRAGPNVRRIKVFGYPPAFFFK
nr:hypothetical protein [Pelagibacterium sediminicola]